MLKRTLVFGQHSYLSLQNRQLRFRSPADPPRDEIVPLEDIGVILIEHSGITISAGLMRALVDNGSSIILCDATHHPCAMLLPMAGNSTHTEVLRNQIELKASAKKQLWSQIVRNKLRNQAALLNEYSARSAMQILKLSQQIKSGDSSNREGVAAKIYWGSLMQDFTRDRESDGTNSLLNYGYAILRAATARALVGSGLHCAIGLHHTNRYNPFCLVDDVMEPYRPFVDRIVKEKVSTAQDATLDKANKRALLETLTCDVFFEKEKSPLSIALTRTSASIVKVLRGEQKELVYPKLS